MSREANRSRRGSRISRVALLGAVAAAGTLGVEGTANAVQYPLNHVVSSNPADWTPQVLNGNVEAVVQVGNTIVIGGTFTSVSQTKNGATMSRSHIMAFDAQTGKISSSFVPKLDGEVQSLAASPDGNVFVGGGFKHVNGAAVSHLVKLSVSNGARISGFRAQASGPVKTLKVSGGKLYVGGSFSVLSGAHRLMLGAVDATTGKIDPSLNLAVAGKHNGGATGIMSLDVAGGKLVAAGNFTTVNGQPREQLFLVNLPGTLSSWATTRLTTMCAKGWDTYAQMVDFSADGSYFALATSGGSFKNSLCDSVSRWNANATGPNQTEQWANYTGGDSLLSVAVTPAAIYTGGHQRWMNNKGGHNAPTATAIPREGIAAVSPSNGATLPWNPSRTRGHGAGALLVTSAGLWVGSDTTMLGHEYHARIGFFPA